MTDRKTVVTAEIRYQMLLGAQEFSALSLPFMISFTDPAHGSSIHAVAFMESSVTRPEAIPRA